MGPWKTWTHPTNNANNPLTLQCHLPTSNLENIQERCPLAESVWAHYFGGTGSVPHRRWRMCTEHSACQLENGLPTQPVNLRMVCQLEDGLSTRVKQS